MEIKTKGYSYKVEVTFTLTGEMYKRMAECSDNHYDAVCRNSNQRGGFLYGWKNELWFSNTGPGEAMPAVIPDEWNAEITVTSRDLDTLCKICEGETYGRYGKPQLKYEDTLLFHFSKMMDELNAEWKRVNGKQ